MEQFLEKAKSASRVLATMSGSERNRILREMAEALRANTMNIIEANALDMRNAQESSLAPSMKERLLLDEKRIDAMAVAILEIAALKDPIGKVIEGWVTEAGLKIEKVSIPIGVIGIIYESRPNVTSDTAALCFKSSNGCVLKGGKEAEASNKIIADVLQQVLVRNNLPKELIALLPDATREGVAKLIKMDQYVDLIVPRGGEALIRFVSQNASVPVVKHDKGLCHTYIDKGANIENAIAIALNAKVQRPGVCNSMETLLVDGAIAAEVLPILKEAFERAHTQLKGCELTREVIDVETASEEDFDTEYLANILNIRVVDGVEGAISHIVRFGSGHSEAIITENITTSERFMDCVDAAAVYVNASTRFTDGGAFGFGAEVGISTNKLHARGPMGVEGLTTYKYKVYGKGQIR
ncbi:MULTISPECIES: glutamate-5-semialdehyde dehydrogenase [unclassified Sulfuricurvum]|uniref:glutamate-5-semialdehyde dehydrogenase n=1 Tax=unclassified Sulfuricurvum TaxID=2632390 RepID=UPI0002997869|nr:MULTISPECIES: glutamate-5-semialdehyde dehydrogenase [unclassified Sulfuricurvum]OHD82811.1 MAG: glutamate-5-semialdehyde dehydrogenase [Sulfuricurvum sp. RIFCSPHIGHO2_02_FULL_43_9]OHD84793.1 MAG: glutamate-5-semialdehyde dehydrogenase [Sulfuricurvum sp. RIFCSPLOWO2_02_43_6]OHD86289.1 MAG: glutamate-5-semialdehyde dehydrogenase [Sulfuricurvum sp. RIFCSPLOWO2_02_FULL_43_45]OHD88187.1 MAG: glutamate-5-semialdehyde dehydrogenase [Sulfuricurvum sp. RIFCSPHIGHO2_12_FULL_44_8]AFV96667.1 gamma-glu